MTPGLKWLSSTVLVFLITIHPIFSQTINFKSYGVSEGIANSNAYYSLQDSRGFLWIATSSGVNRFDGKKFELFTTDHGLADNEVLSIFEDSKGRIWFLNFNGRLGYYFDGKFFNPENDHLLKTAITNASIINCFEDSSNRLWFSTNQQQILEVDKHKVTVHLKSSDSFDISNTFIFEDEQSRILAANTKGFYHLGKRAITKVATKYLPLSFKSSKYDSRTKQLLYLSKEGLIKYNKGEFKIVRAIPPELRTVKTGSFLINKNALWISSVDNGLYIVKPDGKTVAHYLGKKIISNTMLDREGNIWVTTFGDGLILLPAHTENILQYTTFTGLPENDIYSVLKDYSNRLWLGLKSGYICIIDGKDISTINLEHSNLPYNPVKRLEHDKERNSIWFTSNITLGEINIENSKRTIRYLKEKNNLTFSPKSFTLSKKGKLAFSLASGVYVLNDKNAELIFETGANSATQRFFRDRAFKVYYDSKERLWFSNVNGLFRFHNNKIDTLSRYSDLFSKRVTDMLELPDGTMVIGTHGQGLILFNKDNQLTRIGIKEGLTSNICRRLAFDGKYIWLTTFSGVDKFEYQASTNTIRTYKVKNGLTSDEVLDIFIDHEQVFLGTNAGLTVLPRNDPEPALSPPLFYITGFLANGQQYKIREVPNLRYDENNISVTFTAINYSQLTEFYQYRLNDNSPWIDISNNNIEFGSLEPGKYQVGIRGKLRNSNWSNPAMISFIIKPAFWQHWWFLAAVYFLSSLLLIGLIYLYFKKRRRQELDALSVQAKILALEQRALQAMMNPHFVFNIMNSIQYFINTKDSQAANKVLTGFARLIRKNLEICTKSHISLEEELVYLKLYLSLEKLRFGDKMIYEIALDEQIDTEETMIPTMLLQPFIENAIWHGIMPKDEGGTIHINVDHDNDLLTIQIIDNGTGIDNSLKNKNSSHVSRGMQITNDRIQLLNKNNKRHISIHTGQTGDFGTKVTVKIPV